ncbi:hypothetical protein Pmani_024962 [Petrolisthes manimaculis]|uniref:Prenylcysteine lyase domain-containing protein n=1 Tax=Petrolisthes manimaculis TaxID=1843537 RepID=A0AAE1TZG5_9EUCA|nr:hypothetical protein Pmani_024962 [Petrolisthes manimaculis]
MVTAVTLCNYGQTSDIHAFVGAVSIAAADPNLWSVLGGNKRVTEALLKASRASFVTRTVTHVTHTRDGKFVVTSTEETENTEKNKQNQKLFNEGNPSTKNNNNNNNNDNNDNNNNDNNNNNNDNNNNDDNNNSRSQEYDLVILATPLTADKSDIEFVNFTRELSFHGRYERIVCTMVEGDLHQEALNLNQDDNLNEILVTTPSLYFNSIGRQLPVDTQSCPPADHAQPPVWKVFSPHKLTHEQLDALFPNRVSVSEIDWLAYPHYPTNHSGLGPGAGVGAGLGAGADFELVPGLYHVSAVEWAASAMEMSAIGAKNVALLAYKYWTGDDEAGGQDSRDRDEL